VKKTAKEVELITSKLYREAQQLKKMKEKETEDYFETVCTFSPKISDGTKPKLENFYKRLQSWIDKRNEKYMKDIEHSKIDSKTGQPLFSPITSKRDTISLIDRNIFVDLYEETKRIQSNKKEIQEKATEEIVSMASGKKSSDKSGEIYNNMKNECFNKLFEILDHDNDGLVSHSEEFVFNLQSSHINADAKMLLEPLLNELKENNESLNREEFVMAINQLYNVLNFLQKRKFMDWYINDIKRENSPRKRRMQSQENVMTFRPSILETTNQVFNKCERYSKDFTTRNEEFLKKRQSYTEEVMKEKMNNEIKGII
jgi:hypothetical protein